MLLADADTFWKPPTVYDAVGVLGLLLGLISIWLAWWLARRDLEARIARAERRAAAAVHRFILRADLTDVRRHVELANEAQLAANWQRAVLHAEEGYRRLRRLIPHPDLALSARNSLLLTLDRIKVLINAFGQHPRKGQGKLTDVQRALMEVVLAELATVEGELLRTAADQP